MLSLLKRYRELLVVSTLLLFPLWTFLASGNRPRSPHVLDRFVLSVSAPLQRLLTSSFGAVSGVGRSYVQLRGTYQRNLFLEDENTRLKQQVHALEEGRAENERLKRLLNYADERPGPEISARIIGISPVSTLSSVWINRGEGDGVVRGMPVVTPEGVVGFIHQVTGHSAEVLLVSDHNARVGVRVQRSRVRATAAGSGGDRPLSLQYALRADSIQEGDLIITSGTDGIFPPGLVVGTVKELKKHAHGMFQTAEIVPAVDLNKLEEVLILPLSTGIDTSSAQLTPWAQP